MGKIGKRNHNRNKHATSGNSVVRRRQHSQLPPPKSRKREANSGNDTPDRQIKVPFAANDNVLLVGEGDFTFSLSFIQNHKPAAVIATCYDSEQELRRKYPGVEATIAGILRSSRDAGKKVSNGFREEEPFEGFSPSLSALASPFEKSGDFSVNGSDIESNSCQVLYDIDATKLSTAYKKVLRPFSPFSKIVFNFPHVGGLSTDVNRQVRANQQLLVGFFNTAKALLRRRHKSGKHADSLEEEDEPTKQGQILVTLFEGEPYTLWNIRDLARHCNLQVVESYRFPWSAYPGYKHARTIGDITSGKDRSHEGRRKGAWRGEEREARCYVLEMKEEGADNVQAASKKRRHGADSSDED